MTECNLVTVTAAVRARLYALRDGDYAVFMAKLLPTVDPQTILGVRTPDLRRLARELSREADIGRFLDDLPHAYYEENNLHSFIISAVRDYDTALARTEAFLPYVDNWATCDSFSPKAFCKHHDRLAADILRWMGSDRPYTVRFGIEMVQSHFLDEDFDPVWLERVSAVRSDEYYVNMMTAWFFATALTKRWDDALPYIEGNRLDAWTHNKAIQKAIESRCITDERKAHLRSLKRKN